MHSDDFPPNLPASLTPLQRAHVVNVWRRAPAGKRVILLIRAIRQIRDYGRPYSATDVDRLLDRAMEEMER